MSSQGINAFDIQSHLYSSFLQGRTPDVALRVSGRWHAVYQLHRVVLIQSDFFRSLFTSGFRESVEDVRSRRRGADEISIIFDDANITRAAFEICLSRLYGGGPPLHLPQSLVPSTSEPLSTSFISGILPEPVPEGYHPATPRFLLSLLATSLYLSIPAVASQALSMIFKTIGPYTVTTYLNFALGKSIDYAETLWADPEAGVGLEKVAELLDDEGNSLSPEPDAGELSAKISSLRVEGNSSGYDTTSKSSAVSLSETDSVGTPHHYGPISDKIGAACSCWIARWAPEMLAFEQEKEASASRPTSPAVQERPVRAEGVLDVVSSGGPYIWRRGGLHASWVSALISSDTFFVKNERERYDFARSVVELRRKHGIIPNEERHWTTMFETGIYYANMPAEDLITLSRDTSPTTNKPYVSKATLKAAMWSQSLLRHQITYRPPSSPGSPASPPPRDKEIGLGIPTQDLAHNTDDESSTPQFYYPVFGDASTRLGDNGGEAQSPSDGKSVSMEELFLSPPAINLTRQTVSRGSTHKVPVEASTPRIPSSEESVFGLKAERYTLEECVAADSASTRRWTSFPPTRFGVEFWDIDTLKEKSRLHSHTIWHAGSLFNIYIQLVKKKGQIQLGIYLQRQSSIEPIPSISAPSPDLSRSVSDEDSGTTSERFATISHRPVSPRESSMSPFLSRMVAGPSSPTLHSSRSLNVLERARSQTLPSSSISPASSSSLSSTPNNNSNGFGTQSSVTLPYTSNGIAPIQPYRDPRPLISAYFSITCANATGSSQMKFTSSPDVFSVGQSWGWKTSSLRTEEYMEIRPEGSSEPIIRGRLKSLRATVVLGLT
ncbi:hypothetical protein CC1G_03747 [Coprinopsis cinerea okayama7|uniref:BTB domain-containing protein n=1 Tax=Coprinopsis cinerea (strain Okayama-7 / 130 / ATCC MYA-4618 / FGSC 9003) TaxID=240176 RepID=A8N280_COPC7|nr:hypothetical protein CC1G_03747 [Coprinopsis cinerea okayama7\|eukprot:XP_001828953.1 hypothetical protein CC1G_03747 [Coprinopsis cinerea okayama7\